METPNALKGHFYPSSRVSRCPMFHACTVTKKCQNYDIHCQQCNICESRTNTHEVDPDSVPLGGYLPEGEYHPDIQDAFAELEKMIGVPFAHPDQESQKMNSKDIARKIDREEKIINMIKTFSSCGALSMDETVAGILQDPEKSKYLGRLE